MDTAITWRWQRYNDLTRDNLYGMLEARQAVFVVEQQCPYADADFLDSSAWHLSGCDGDGRMLAYARVLFPGVRFEEPSIGRLLTVAKARGRGLGRLLLDEAVDRCQRTWPRRGIRISAQCYLETFYRDAGFATVGAPYDEDGIAHIEMVRPFSQRG